MVIQYMGMPADVIPRFLAGCIWGWILVSFINSRYETESRQGIPEENLPLFATLKMRSYTRAASEKRKEKSRNTVPKYQAVISGSMLPIVLFVTILSSVILGGGYINSFHESVSGWLMTFLLVGIYYIFLLPFLPMLRKKLNPRTVALLWIVPNYLYVTFIYDLFVPEAPVVIFSIPDNILAGILAVWFAGFAVIMGWNIFRHLVFRKYILKDSRPVTDYSVLKIWDEILELAIINKPRFSLVVSDKISTPLSIGLSGFSKNNVKVVLPDRYYTEEELRLIFLHEVIHVSREDSWYKFFFVLCCAICWFNPFVWVAMKKSAEDLELSCDETVLLNADEATRKKYADLILNTASDGRGFTTCLSANAKSMLYRLQNIVKPRKYESGTLLIGIVFCLLATVNGYAAVTYGEGTGADYIFTDGHYSRYKLTGYSPEMITINSEKEAELMEYIASLEITRITGEYKYNYNIITSFKVKGPKKDMYIGFYENVVVVKNRNSVNDAYGVFYVKNGIDEKYIKELVNSAIIINEEYRREEDTYIDYELHPVLKANAYTKKGKYVNYLKASLELLTEEKDGAQTVLYKHPYYDNSFTGYTGVTGYDYIGYYSLEFSLPLAAPVKVVVKNKQENIEYTIEQEDISQPLEIEELGGQTYYTVYAQLISEEGAIYNAEYIFHRGFLSYNNH